MKKLKSILTLAFLAFLLAACNGNLEMIEGNGSVNLLIFPYLTFEPAEEEEYYEAYVVEGAAVTEIAVPGAVEVDGSEVPVKVFGGFRNPGDAAGLEKIILDSNIEAIGEGALDQAANISAVSVIGDVSGSFWMLPSMAVEEGWHFLWKAGDVYVKDGDPIDPANSTAYAVVGRHSAMIAHDGTYHWSECEECHEVIGSKEEHHFITTASGAEVCEYCGYQKGSGSSSGGFDVDVEFKVPEGDLKVEPLGMNSWKFSFVNKKDEYPPTAVSWYVNNVKQADADEWDFFFTASGKKSYVIMCVFRNEHGGGSCSASVTGR